MRDTFDVVIIGSGAGVRRSRMLSYKKERAS